ncbi:MAG: peptidase M48 [OM182 bacterium MED-G24]|uniref:Putative beta-barrel assembly-enhancing protease n=1 Tax=OM182 bacterium MED-G24 TaxID=1986255 RepID=A0A2A5WHV7_9GAMM|nr:MAG: peptidase M48 [OM182 bacterium MED-G24]
MILKQLCHFALYALLICSIMPSATAERNLPDLGDRSSGIISLELEREIGKDFLRQLRRSAPYISDPLLQDYVEHLTFRLAANSELSDKRLDLIVLAGTDINAFAAPGGIVGINLGLFIHGETEHEFAAILAHELAHLSQRHFARQIEAAEQPALINAAGLLAGIVLSATTGLDAGLAAITAGQALALDQMLRHSRAREREADRLGISTLVRSGHDPAAMAAMFERLERSHRFAGDNLPEFLRTHPITSARIADSLNQVTRLPRQTFAPSLDYHLMRNRVRIRTNDNPRDMIGTLSDDIVRYEQRSFSGDQTVLADASRYGLVLALQKNNQHIDALREIRSLRERYPLKISLLLAEADVLTGLQSNSQAIDLLRSGLALSPGNYPLSMALALLLSRGGSAADAAVLLTPLTAERPNDIHLWYELAEIHGLADNTLAVHEARAEYFVLAGNPQQAIRQLRFALPLVQDNFQRRERIRRRILDIEGLAGRMPGASSLVGPSAAVTNASSGHHLH